MSEPSGDTVLSILDTAEITDNEPVKPASSETPPSDEQSPETEHNPHLVYRLQYRNVYTFGIVYTREHEEPIVIESKGGKGPKQLPALELITDVETSATVEGNEQLKDPPHNLLRVGKAELKINSPAIINALQKVVEYYPQLDFSGESISVTEPFEVLIHHENELASLRENYAPGKIRSESEHCDREKNTYEHLAVLQNLLKQRVGLSVETERTRHKRGFATFNMLWMLFKPGTTVYCDTWSDGKYNAYVIQSVSGGVADDRTNSLAIEMWYLDFDGTRIGKRGFTKNQAPFNGEKRISALEVFPCEFWEDNSTEKAVKSLRESLEERGKMFLKLTSRRCMSFDGLTSTVPRRHVGTNHTMLIPK